MRTHPDLCDPELHAIEALTQAQPPLPMPRPPEQDLAVLRAVLWDALDDPSMRGENDVGQLGQAVASAVAKGRKLDRVLATIPIDSLTLDDTFAEAIQAKREFLSGRRPHDIRFALEEIETHWGAYEGCLRELIGRIECDPPDPRITSGDFCQEELGDPTGYYEHELASLLKNRDLLRTATIPDGLTGAIDDVHAFMAVGQPDQIATTPQPIRGAERGESRALVRDVAETCAIHAKHLRADGAGPEALSLRLLVEELGEIAEALHRGDVAGYADGLVDLVYIALGAGLRAGLPLDRVWAAVHAANLAKFPTCADCAGTGRVRIQVSPAVSFFSGYNETPEVNCLLCAGVGRIVLRDEHGKVQKPDGWTAPDVAAILGDAHGHG